MFKNTRNYYHFPENYTPAYKKQSGEGVIADMAKGVAKEVARGATTGVIGDTLGEIGGAVGKNVSSVQGIMAGDMSEENISKVVSTAIELFKFGKVLATPPKYKGEKHGILKMPDGSYARGNFIGPGTAVNERLRQGGEVATPKTPVDAVAKRHDIEYWKANSTEDVRKADEKMLNSVAKIKASGGDHPFNLTHAQLIAFKTKLEDLGVSPESFTSFGGFEAMPQQDQNNQEQALADLVQQGYGTKWDDPDVDRFKDSQVPLPADRLYNKLVKKNKRKKKQKIPKKIQERILRNMDVQDQFDEQGSVGGVPDNVRIALASM